MPEWVGKKKMRPLVALTGYSQNPRSKKRKRKIERGS